MVSESTLLLASEWNASEQNRNSNNINKKDSANNNKNKNDNNEWSSVNIN